MKFKHTDPQIKDTEGIGVTQPGDIIEELRPEVIERLLKNPFFKKVEEKKAKDKDGD